MPQRSPIMRFALEVFEHALESYVSEKHRDRKLAVLNLAQVLELAIKAALVEKNVPIYEKDGARTINTHNAVTALAKLWAMERIPMQARLELLIDERNAIQHRYGSVDEVTMDYHMQTAFTGLAEILQREFDADLQEWVRSNVDENIWRRVRFVEQGPPDVVLPSTAIVDARSATLDFVDGFSKYERAVREGVTEAGEDPATVRSTLDLVVKFLANIVPSPGELVTMVPEVYRVRNQVIHGHRDATQEEVGPLLRTLDDVVRTLREPAHRATFKAAIQASAAGIRGTRGVRASASEPRLMQNAGSEVDAPGAPLGVAAAAPAAQQGAAADAASRRG